MIVTKELKFEIISGAEQLIYSHKILQWKHIIW